jgi:hypothetical protein
MECDDRSEISIARLLGVAASVCWVKITMAHFAVFVYFYDWHLLLGAPAGDQK